MAECEVALAGSDSVFIGLYNPKSPSNVGAVMRAAGCYEADAVRYTGVRFERAARFNTDTRKILNSLTLTGTDDLLSDLPDDMTVVCVEFAEGATPLPDFVHPQRAIYLFGPEDGNLSQELVNRASHVVYVPTVGCMNLAATVNVVLYDRLAKKPAGIDSEVAIKRSRDNNNRLRVNVANGVTNKETDRDPV